MSQLECLQNIVAIESFAILGYATGRLLKHEKTELLALAFGVNAFVASIFNKFTMSQTQLNTSKYYQVSTVLDCVQILGMALICKKLELINESVKNVLYFLTASRALYGVYKIFTLGSKSTGMTFKASHM